MNRQRTYGGAGLRLNTIPRSPQLCREAAEPRPALEAKTCELEKKSSQEFSVAMRFPVRINTMKSAAARVHFPQDTIFTSAPRSGTNTDHMVGETGSLSDRERSARLRRPKHTAGRSLVVSVARFSQHQPLLTRHCEGGGATTARAAALVAFSFATTFQAMFRLSPSCVLEFGRCCWMWTCQTGHLCFAVRAEPQGSSARSCRTHRDTSSRSAGTMTEVVTIASGWRSGSCHHDIRHP